MSEDAVLDRAIELVIKIILGMLDEDTGRKVMQQVTAARDRMVDRELEGLDDTLRRLLADDQ